MTIPLFAKPDSMSEYVEIGRTGRIEVLGANGTLPIMLPGIARYAFAPENGLVRVNIQGFQMPVDGPNFNLNSTPPLMNMSLSDLKAVLACIVHQLGGAFIVHADEFNMYSKSNLECSWTQGPSQYLTIKIQENQ